MLQAQSSAGRRPVRHSHAVEPWALKICCDRRPIGRVVAPLLPAIAKTCCAPLCDVAPVGHQVQRQGEVTVTGRLTATRSLLVSTHCSASPRPSGLSSSHHQKRSPCAGDYLWVLCKMGVFLLGGTGSARQGTLRVCAHDLIHLSIPIAIHLHTRHVGRQNAILPLFWAEKEIYGCVVVQLWCVHPPRGRALPHCGARRLCC